MTWIPFFDVSSKNFDEDIKPLKTVFEQFEKQIHFKEGFKFDPEAQLAMGWWFYTIYIKIGFIKELVAYNHTLDPKVKDEKAILKIVEKYMKIQKSSSRVKFHGKKPLLSSYWSWLMK